MLIIALRFTIVLGLSLLKDSKKRWLRMFLPVLEEISDVAWQILPNIIPRSEALQQPRCIPNIQIRTFTAIVIIGDIKTIV